MILYSQMEIIFFDEDSSKVTFYANEMCILGVDLDKAWRNKFEKCKALKTR